MQDRMNRMNRLFRESYSPEGPEEALTTTSYAPPVDIYEDEHNITLKLEVPGIDEKDIDVRIEGNTLTVHGERKIEKEEKEENFRRVERQYGEFTRSFTLPSSVDPGQVSAHYDKGVLKINLAKKAEAKPKQIKVTCWQREDTRSQSSRQGRVKPAGSERNGSWLTVGSHLVPTSRQMARQDFQRLPFSDFGTSLEALLWFAFQRLANREKKDGTLAFRVRRKEVNHVIVEEG